jgi:hypothetical protein
MNANNDRPPSDRAQTTSVQTHLVPEPARELRVLLVPHAEHLRELAVSLAGVCIDLSRLAGVLDVLELAHALLKLDLLREHALTEEAGLLELFLLCVNEGLELEPHVGGRRGLGRVVCRHAGGGSSSGNDGGGLILLLLRCGVECDDGEGK